MGLLLLPPFQLIIFCSFLCQFWKCKSHEKAFHYSFGKNDAHSSFSPESAPALQKSRNHGFTFHQRLYCNTGSGQPECHAVDRLLTINGFLENLFMLAMALLDSEAVTLYKLKAHVKWPLCLAGPSSWCVLLVHKAVVVT